MLAYIKIQVLYIGLDIQCVNCYSKGVGYEPGDNLTSTNHEYNIIKLDNKYYPIDCTWGSGNIEKKRFKKKLNEFYFLANPELLINTHFPANDMWQLTKRKYTLQEFLNWPQVKETFYSYGFNRYLPSQGLIELNSNAQKFTILIVMCIYYKVIHIMSKLMQPKQTFIGIEQNSTAYLIKKVDIKQNYFQTAIKVKPLMIL